MIINHKGDSMNFKQLVDLALRVDEVFATKLQPMYFSKLHKVWKTCESWELPNYLKYGYRVKYEAVGVTPAYMLFG